MVVDPFTKSVLGVVPGVMAIGVAGEALKTIPKFKSSPTKRGSPFSMRSPKVSAKPFVKSAGKILVGTALIGATSSLINKL